MNEEELQHKIESGEPLGNSDAEAYRQVFNALKTEPELKISASFADRIVNIVEVRQKKRHVPEMFWLAAGIVLLLIAFGVAVAMTNFKPSMGFLSAMSSYTGLFIFGIVFIGLLNWIDKRFIHNNQASY